MYTQTSEFYDLEIAFLKLTLLLWVKELHILDVKSTFEPCTLGSCSNDLSYSSDLDFRTRDSRGHLSLVLDSSNCYCFDF